MRNQFLELTRIDNSSVWINILRILYIDETVDYSSIYFENGSSVRVKEEVDKIFELLDEAEKKAYSDNINLKTEFVMSAIPPGFFSGMGGEGDGGEGLIQ